MSSSRLDRERAPHQGRRGKGQAAVQEDQDVVDDDDDDGDEEEEDSTPTATSSTPMTTFASLPHPTPSYQLKTRQPSLLPLQRPAPPAIRNPKRQLPAREEGKRWAPEKGAKGKARQPKMGEKMDGLLAKIRKGL